MKIYLIKRKGANIWKNMEFSYIVGDAYAQLCFYRKKDAKSYLDTFTTNDHLEVISAEMKESKQDNRKS